MKRNNLFYLFVFAAIVLTLSCEKESTTNTSASTAATGAELRIDPDDMEDSMNVFITETMDSDPVYSEYEAQDGLLIIEAALNYHEGQPGEYYDEMQPDTVYYTTTLKRVSGEYKWISDSLEIIWNRILDDAQDAPGNVTFDDPNDPFDVVIDLEWTDVNLESSESYIRGTFRGVEYIRTTI